MGEDAHEEPFDNFVVEITDLDRPGRQARSLRPHLTPRQRRLSVAATVALFVLVVGLLLGSVSEIRALLGQAFNHSTSSPTPSLSTAPMSVSLRGNPTWGRFTLDGKILAHPPAIGSDQPLQLSHGLHTITWQAAPFTPRTCVFTIYDASTIKGPCFLNNSVTANLRSGVVVIAFFASLNDLPTGQRVPLTQQIQKQFDGYESRAQVQPGELYAVSEREAQANPALCKPFEGLALCYARAEQPLIATLSLQADTLTSRDDPCVLSGQCNINQQDCRIFCEDPVVDYSQATIGSWSVIAMLRLSWSYRTLDGQMIASSQPNSAIRGSYDYQSVSLHIERDNQGGWRITPFPSYSFFFGTPICAQATGVTMSVLGASFDDNANMYVSQFAANPAQMADGCLTVARQPTAQFGATPTPTPTADTIPPAFFLLRFGVPLAVNASARKICPDLPAADADEERVAQNLLTSFSSLA